MQRLNNRIQLKSLPLIETECVKTQYTQSADWENTLVTFISEVVHTKRIVLYWTLREAKRPFLSRCQRKYAFSRSTVGTNHLLRYTWKIGAEFSTTVFPVKGFNWTRSSSSRRWLRMLHIHFLKNKRTAAKCTRQTAFVCIILEIDADVTVNIANVHQNWFPDFSKLGFQHKYVKASLRAPVTSKINVGSEQVKSTSKYYLRCQYFPSSCGGFWRYYMSILY